MVHSGNKTELSVWSNQDTEAVGRQHSFYCNPGRQQNTDLYAFTYPREGNMQLVKPAGLDTYSPGEYASALGFLYFKATVDSY